MEREKRDLALGSGEVPARVSYTSDGELVVLLRQHKRFKNGAGKMIQGTISVGLWNLTSGKRSPFIKIDPGAVAVSPKGDLLAYDDGLWDVATGKKLRTVPLPSGLVFQIEFSPDGKTVLYRISESLAQDFALLFLADIATGKKVLQIGEIDLKKQRDGCTFLFGPKFSTDGKRVAFSEVDRRKSLHLWDVARGKALHCIPLKEPEQVVGFSPDGRTLVSWDQIGGSVRLWETVTGKERHALKVASGLDAVLLSLDGNTVALLKVVLSWSFLQSGGQIEQADSPVRKLLGLYAVPKSHSDFFAEDESLQSLPLVGVRRTTLLLIPRTTSAVH